MNILDVSVESSEHFQIEYFLTTCVLRVQGIDSWKPEMHFHNIVRDQKDFFIPYFCLW